MNTPKTKHAQSRPVAPSDPASSDPNSPDHVCTDACTHEPMTPGKVGVTDAPTKPGAGATRAR